MAKKPATERDTASKAADPDPEDVEGHSMLDPWSGMRIAESKDREIKDSYRRKSLEEEARRPHRKEGR